LETKQNRTLLSSGYRISCAEGTSTKQGKGDLAHWCKASQALYQAIPFEGNVTSSFSAPNDLLARPRPSSFAIFLPSFACPPCIYSESLSFSVCCRKRRRGWCRSTCGGCFK